MKCEWPKVKIGEVLEHRKEFIIIDDLATYKRPRVQVHARGIVLRDNIVGSLIKTKKQQVCRAGEFLVAEIDAKVGGFGIVPDTLDEAIVSSHYFLFVLNREKMNTQFLNYFIRTPAFRDQVEAQGSTNYAAIRPSHVLNYEIPLPPLPEQRRIVSRIEQVAEKIQSAQALRKQAAEEAGAIRDSVMNNILSKSSFETTWEFGRIPLFAEVNPSRSSMAKLKHEDYVTFVPMRSVDDITGTIAWPEKRPFCDVSKGYTWFREGDVIFALITPCMQNGKSAIARNLINDTAFGSTEFHVLRPGPKLMAEWLHALVRYKAFRDDAASHFKGTAGQQRVPQNFLEEKIIPVPPLSEQRRIVAELDTLQEQVNKLKRMQSETAVELDALMPSILDKAFKGEL
jgi:type I restriction enzyme S subunit